jgi:hypothetical protein
MNNKNRIAHFKQIIIVTLVIAVFSAITFAIPDEVHAMGKNSTAHAAYKKAVKNGKLGIRNDAKYAFYDINGDGVDELVVDNEDYLWIDKRIEYTVYTFYKGKIKKLLTTEAWLYVWKKTGTILNQGGHGGVGFDKYYKIKKGKAVKVAQKYSYRDYADGESYIWTHKYKVNNKSVKAPVYNKYIKALKKGKKKSARKMKWKKAIFYD